MKASPSNKPSFDMNSPKGIIVDVGMHDGKDTFYYASRGYKVIAFEANPELCLQVQNKLKTERYEVEIRNAAISDNPGFLDFYINGFNSTWSSLNQELGCRKGVDKVVQVRSCSLDTELADLNNITYVKIDIEGYDLVALRQVLRLKNRPFYISVENGSIEMLDLLLTNGYGKFKLSNQKYVRHQKVPSNTAFGDSIDYSFEPSSSGLWGDDIDGRWFSYDEMTLLINALTAARQLAPNNLFAEAVGWFDLHAKCDIVK